MLSHDGIISTIFVYIVSSIAVYIASTAYIASTVDEPHGLRFVSSTPNTGVEITAVRPLSSLRKPSGLSNQPYKS